MIIHDRLRSRLAQLKLCAHLLEASGERFNLLLLLAEEAEASRKFFVQLRDLHDALEKEFDVKLPHLSMGMTNDFPVAVEEGATLVRVGTAIFGERSKARRD